MACHRILVKPSEKLPAIYLIDSIIKDLNKSSYKSSLMKNIVHTFTSVFEKVDKKTRVALYKVRQTWVGVFPNSKLYSIDMQIKSHLDPTWPITATPSKKDSTRVDQRFLQLRQQQAEAKVKEVEEEDYLKQEDKLSDLFGREDQDYRSRHTHCSTSDVVKMGSLLLQSPSSKGWDTFKTNYSEDYAYNIKLKRQHPEAQDTVSHMSTTDFQDGIVPTNVSSLSQHGAHISKGMFPAQGPPVPNSMLPQYYTRLQPRPDNLPGPHAMPQTSVAMGSAMQGSLSLMDPRTLQPSLLGPGPRLTTSPLQHMWPQLSPLASLPALVPPAVNPIPAQPTVDVSSLFSKLVAAGIITSNKEPVKMETR